MASPFPLAPVRLDAESLFTEAVKGDSAFAAGSRSGGDSAGFGAGDSDGDLPSAAACAGGPITPARFLGAGALADGDGPAVASSELLTAVPKRGTGIGLASTTGADVPQTDPGPGPGPGPGR